MKNKFIASTIVLILGGFVTKFLGRRYNRRIRWFMDFIIWHLANSSPTNPRLVKSNSSISSKVICSDPVKSYVVTFLVYTPLSIKK